MRDMWRTIADRGRASRGDLLSGETYPAGLRSTCLKCISHSARRHRSLYTEWKGQMVGDLSLKEKTFLSGEEITHQCRLISYILLRKNHLNVLTLQGMYEYKMYGSFSDVTAEEFLYVQNDLSKFRLSWDNR